MFNSNPPAPSFVISKSFLIIKSSLNACDAIPLKGMILYIKWEHKREYKMNITKSKLEALKFYLSFRAPKLVGSPEFTEWCSERDEYITWINETDFTKAEYRTLVKGAEVFEYLQDQLEEVSWEMVDAL